jgi:tetratricopeptide (TPR) repeat protein
MTDNANNGDNSLWARLNALKIKSQETKSDISQLQSRFQALKGTSSADAKDKNQIVNPTERSAVEDAANAYMAHEQDGEPDVDQLLKDLGSDGDFGPEKDHKPLLNEAQKALREAAEDLPDPEVEGGEKQDEEKEEPETENRSDAGDSDAAAEYLEKVLAEISIDQKDPGILDKKEEAGGDSDEGDSSKLLEDLPSPSAKQLDVHIDKTTKTGDFEERLAALLKDKKETGSTGDVQPEVDPTEEWCIICYDDATVQCVGCDGDLYCTKCWKEGHTGPDAGLEERRHKALTYNKSTKKKRQLVAG